MINPHLPRFPFKSKNLKNSARKLYINFKQLELKREHLGEMDCQKQPLKISKILEDIEATENTFKEVRI